MKILVLGLSSLLISLSAGAELKPDNANGYRFEVTANSYRHGEAIEIGLISPTLFKLQKDSRHYWSVFGTLGMNTLSNILLDGKTVAEEELINIEATLGIFAQAKFYEDFIYQYGKVAVDHISFDSKMDESAATGVVLESGLEFKSSVAKTSLSKHENPIVIHMGLRWRAGFQPLKKVSGDIDPIEGISFVIGSRLTF